MSAFRQRVRKAELVSYVVGISAAFAIPAAAQQQTTTQIILTQPYTDTKLQVGSGQTVTVVASGNMNWFTGGCNYGDSCVSTPDGQTCPYTGFFAQGLPCWSLIGKIGDGPPFEVGSSSTFVASTSGELYLGVNDNNYPDNTGSWTATATINATECPTISWILPEQQFSPPWGSQIYDSMSPPMTIAQFGCYLTDVVMLINYYAAVQNSTFRTDPGTLNTYLKGVQGGYFTGGMLYSGPGYYTGGSVNPYAVARYARDNGVNMWFIGNAGADDEVVNTYLCSGNPPLLEVNRTTTSQHWIIATGNTALNGMITYSTVDPGGYPNGSTLEGFGNEFEGVSLYSSTPSPPSAIQIVAHSPIAPMVTSSTGLQTGLALGGAQLHQIAASSYYESELANALNNEDPPSPLTKFINIQNPSSGIYALTLTGVASGSYRLDVSVYDNLGGGDTKSFSGITIAGLVSNMTINYSSEVGNKSVVTAFCAGDVNGDGVVDGTDLAIVRAAFGTRHGSAGYNSAADVNHDGVVDILDFSFVSRSIGCTTQSK